MPSYSRRNHHFSRHDFKFIHTHTHTHTLVALSVFTDILKMLNSHRILEEGNLIYLRTENQKYKHSTIPDLCFYNPRELFVNWHYLWKSLKREVVNLPSI